MSEKRFLFSSDHNSHIVKNGECVAYRFQCSDDLRSRQLSCKRGSWTMNPKKLCLK